MLEQLESNDGCEPVCLVRLFIVSLALHEPCSKHIFRASCVHAPVYNKMSSNTVVKKPGQGKESQQSLPVNHSNQIPNTEPSALAIAVPAYVFKSCHMWVGWQNAKASVRVCRHSAEITHT